MLHERMHSNRAAVLALYRHLFDALEHAGVDYCVWKNLNDLSDALAGHGDIDILVRPHSRSAFLDKLRVHGFVRVETHKAYPWVAHYYGLDAQTGALCHIHCYFRIVTGESHIKQYVVPLERYLDHLPAARNSFGVREIHPWLQLRLYLFRRRIKLSCLPGALLYYKERAGYHDEHKRLDLHHSVPVEQLPVSGWPTTIAGSGPLQHEIIAGLGYRRRFVNLSRFAPFTTTLHRYGAVLARALGKLRRKRKKLPLGLIVAVSAERAQAEELNRELENWLGSEFQLCMHQLDDSDSTPRRLLTRCRRRRQALRAAVRQCTDGSIVICYGWNSESLQAALIAAVSVPGISNSYRLNIERCAAQLDDEVEFDMVLHAGNKVVAKGEYPGMARVEVELGDTVVTARWRHVFWQELLARQP